MDVSFAMARGGLIVSVLLLCCLFSASLSQSADTCSANEGGTCSNNDGDTAAKSTEITGFSVFTARPGDAAAFVQDLHPLIAASRAEPDSRGYRMFTDPTKPGLIGFVEGWASTAALQEHLQSETVRQTFDHQYYKELVAAPTLLMGPWVQVPDKLDGEEIEMVFYWTMSCPKKHIWDIITNWTDASWVHGDPKTTIVPLDENGKPMSDEAAKKKGYVDPEGGLGPVVQRRTWANGLFVDVRMLSKDEANFTTVQETLSSLVFPTVVFDKFFVTLSLDSEGLDPDLESRMRYHVRATLKNGTFDDARNTLKNDFYGPRIEFYKKYFNCSEGVLMRRAENTTGVLYSSLKDLGKGTLIAPLFETKSLAEDYRTGILGTGAIDDSAVIDVKNPVPYFATPDLRVVAVEDVTVTSISGTSVRPRIVIYNLNEWGYIVSTRIFDELALGTAEGVAGKLVKATDKYFETLKLRDIEKMRPLYSKEAVLEDPVSFAPPRTFDSVYSNFYKLATSYAYNRYRSRTFVDVKNRQTAQLVDASLLLASGDKLKTYPVQVFTFDSDEKISRFEAFFRPTTIDFSKLT
eukprot:Plantae.Rhodophyta-Hildenbrandia_rubra.ctg15012.p1 GENE.Plantae.Rhodophyta-Hildenbrandia_rubra.ctg15012~~Plantae.Rhodophyta-Hildenbrandia_rubra.ctg15012.p1  ORF type:complete len:577 (+),score=62.87 Plantae.Rhodophyta-Hildenbrandia_rubra.ctg15012:226-1956(+)